MSEHRPPYEILARVEESVRDFTEAEVVLAEAKQRLSLAHQSVLDQVRNLRDEVEGAHGPSLIGVLRHLYWQQPGISSRAMAEAAGLHVNEMLSAIGPCPSGIFCSVCGAELLRTSRSWKASGFGPPVCPLCKADQQRATSREWNVETLRARFVGEAAVQAPARDWRAAAALVLAYPPASGAGKRG